MDTLSLASTCLLVVDAQRGFTELCPRELPIPGGMQIVPNVNRLLDMNFARIDASQDWHPPDHCSFHGQRDDLYPPHCVQKTWGAEFLPDLHTEKFHTIWRNGYQSDFEAYAITAQHPAYTNLLHAAGIDTVVVCGLATNICCYDSAYDLRQKHFRVFLVEDASAGIDVPKADLWQEETKQRGQEAGICYINTGEIIALLTK